MLCGQVDHCTNQSVYNTSEKVSINLVFVFFSLFISIQYTSIEITLFYFYLRAVFIHSHSHSCLGQFCPRTKGATRLTLRKAPT